MNNEELHAVDDAMMNPQKATMMKLNSIHQLVHLQLCLQELNELTDYGRVELEVMFLVGDALIMNKKIEEKVLISDEKYGSNFFSALFQ